MARKVYRALDAEQIALLESLRQGGTKGESRPVRGQHDLDALGDQLPTRPVRRNTLSRTGPRTENSLAVDPAHARLAKDGDFSWIPTSRNRVIEHMLRINSSVRPQRDQLVVVGHIYWRTDAEGDAAADTVHIDFQTIKVSVVRIDAAVEYAFSETRLAWVARVNRGEATHWEPVYVRALIDPQTGARELNFSVPTKRNRALQSAVRAGTLCLAMLNKVLPTPPAKPVQKKTPVMAGGKKKMKVPKILKAIRHSNTYQDGSSLVVEPAKLKASTHKNAGGMRASTAPSKSILPEPSDNRPYELEWCSRCDGGEIPNCPQCDSTGYFKRYKGSEPSRVVMGRSTTLSGKMNLPVPVGKRSSVADHEAVGRADPLDANRGASSIRDGGQFGSMPLHDNYDD